MEVQGDENKVASFIEELHSEPLGKNRDIHIQNLDITDIAVVGTEKPGFRARHMFD